MVVVTYLKIHSGKQLHPSTPEVAEKRSGLLKVTTLRAIILNVTFLIRIHRRTMCECCIFFFFKEMQDKGVWLVILTLSSSGFLFVCFSAEWSFYTQV